MAAALALQEATEIYGALPERLDSSDSGLNNLDHTKRLVDRAGRDVHERKILSIQGRARLSETFASLKAVSGVTAEVLANLDEAVKSVSKQIRELEEFVGFVEEDAKTLLETIRASHANEYKAAKKQVLRYIDYGKEMHVDSVELYYFLLSLKSEFDPQWQGDKCFENPDELRAYLESVIASWTRVPAVVTSGAFERDLKRLGSKDRQTQVVEALALFLTNPRHTKLNFERVLSRTGYHTIRASLGDRVLLLKESDDAYTAVAVGDHDYVYRAYFKKR